MYLRRFVNSTATQTSAGWQSTWGAFVSNDLRSRYFWFVHLELFTLLSLSLLLVFLPTAPGTTAGMEGFVFICTTALVLVNALALLRLQPYQSRRKWKLPVRICRVCVCVFKCVCNGGSCV